MAELIWLIVIGTSIWVFFDARSIGVKKGQVTGIANMNPVGWLFGCLLLWIIAFPIYLSKRGEFKRINEKSQLVSSSRNPSAHSQVSALEQLEKLAILKEKGHISEQEFSLKKKELLGL